MAEVDVRALIEEVGATFGRDVDGWLACFADPFVAATDAATIALDHDAARAMGTQMFDELRERGFDHTELQDVVITPQGDDVAFAHARFIRRRADGSILEPIEASYLCRKRTDRWVVATLIP
jgi:hypothetical protein